jgi:hypothetical protein
VHDTIYLSPTKIQLYQSVPFDYFACYLLHIKDERPSIHKDYGSFVHSVLEHSKMNRLLLLVLITILITIILVQRIVSSWKRL